MRNLTENDFVSFHQDKKLHQLLFRYLRNLENLLEAFRTGILLVGWKNNNFNFLHTISRWLEKKILFLFHTVSEFSSNIFGFKSYSMLTTVDNKRFFQNIIF